jgi:acetyl-CoA synthetase
MTSDSSIGTRVSELVEVFSAPDADAAWLLCDRHHPESVAFTLVESDGSRTDLTYGELRERSERFAGVLMGLGVGRGDRVATLMGKSADLVTVLLGTWRIGAVYVPLFTAFAADAVRSRLQGARVKLVVADAAQTAKVPDGAWTLLVAGTGESSGDDSAGPASPLADALSDAVPFAASSAIGGDGAFVHMFTSGTTGAPKGVVHPLRYVAGWQAYLEFTLGVRADSVYWCGADPGWAYGLYAGVVAPMALGLRSILQRGGFDAAATWSTMATLGVTDFAAAPTVFRALRTSEVPVPDRLRLQRLSSAGEPLTAEVNEWAEPTLGLTVHDHYGQTELGMTIGYPHHRDLEIPVVAQTMGVALPGWAVTVLKEGTSTPADVGEPGLLAIEVAASPLMTFTGYADGRSSTQRFTADGAFYLTGDLAVRTAEGTLRFSSRDDDVIIMAGYRIGPFDVESVLAQHDAVAECAVVAAPDPVRGEVIEAFVVLRADATEDLTRELQDHVRTRYAAHAYPRRVHVVASLPKTPSGKIQRGELRRQLRDAAAQAAQ